MTLNLCGILEDGTDPAPGVPLTSARALSLPLGEDVTIQLTVVTRSGSPVSLTPMGTVVDMAVRKRPDLGYAWSPQPIDATGVQANTCTLTLPGAKTLYSPPGQYVYDIWLTKNGQRSQIVPLSQLNFLPVATRS